MTLDFDHFDTRGYTIHEVQDGYTRWAPSYDDTNDGRIDLDALALLRPMATPLHGPAADLGCGTGRVGRWLRERGVEAVDGVDLTEAMLERAQASGAYQRLRLADMTDTGLESGAYRLLTTVLAIGHLPALAPFYREATRLAAPGATLAVVGYHPHFLLNGVPTHFDPPDGSPPVAIRNHVHLFADHVRAAHQAGWQLADMVERVVDDAWVAARPSYARHHHKPVSFAMAWSRQSPTA